MGIYGNYDRLTSPLPHPGSQPTIALAPHQPMKTAPLPEASDCFSPSEASLCHSAAEAVRQHQYPWARVLLNQLIDRQPCRAAYYSNRGLVNLWDGDPIAALQDLNQAIQLAPNLDQAYNNRASCYVAMGQLEQALLDYDRAVELNPFNIRARINLGMTLRDLGDLNSALTCFDEALVFYQLSAYIYAERGRTYHLRGDWNCALADYHRCLQAIAEQPCDLSLEQLAQRVQQWIYKLRAAG